MNFKYFGTIKSQNLLKWRMIIYSQALDSKESGDVLLSRAY